MKVNLRKSNLEALLNGLEDLLVLVSGNEGDGKTLGAETTSTTDTMEVRVGIGGEIVVDGKVDALDIDTTTKDVSGDADTFVEFLELLVTTDTIRRVSRRPHNDVGTSVRTAPPGSHRSGQRSRGSCIRAKACRAR